MKINYSFAKSSGNTCVALGFFDGIHLGHQAIISSTVKKSITTNTIPTVLTFSQRPKNIINNINYNNNLITQKQKEEILNNMGIKLLYCLDFLKIMNFFPEEFIKKILKDTLKAKYVFCGFNYRFGKNAIAGSQELTDICRKYNIEVFVIEPFYINEKPVSSSEIRNLIKNGNIKNANQLLGKPFCIELPIDKITPSNKNAFNITVIHQSFYNNIIIPKCGTYKSYIIIDDIKYDAISYIKNTFINSSIPSFLCETHITNYKDNLHCKNAKLFLLESLENKKT